MQNWIGLIGLILVIPMTYIGVFRLSRNKSDRVGYVLILASVVLLVSTLGIALVLNIWYS